jgi:hypothetical protein
MKKMYNREKCQKKNNGMSFFLIFQGRSYYIARTNWKISGTNLNNVLRLIIINFCFSRDFNLAIYLLYFYSLGSKNEGGNVCFLLRCYCSTDLMLL